MREITAAARTVALDQTVPLSSEVWYMREPPGAQHTPLSLSHWQGWWDLEYQRCMVPFCAHMTAHALEPALHRNENCRVASGSMLACNTQRCQAEV